MQLSISMLDSAATWLLDNQAYLDCFCQVILAFNDQQRDVIEHLTEPLLGLGKLTLGGGLVCNLHKRCWEIRDQYHRWCVKCVKLTNVTQTTRKGKKCQWNAWQNDNSCYRYTYRLVVKKPEASLQARLTAGQWQEGHLLRIDIRLAFKAEQWWKGETKRGN